MANFIGDNANTVLHPANLLSNNVARISGNALSSILQLVVLIVSVTFNVLCNPIVWFLTKTVFNIMTDIFIYLVLGMCSFLINVITHVDDYYTKRASSQNPGYSKQAKRFIQSAVADSDDF